MTSTHNAGRVAGIWYLLLIVIGPLRLMYIPSKLFVHENAPATVNNIIAHEWLFRFGMVSDLAGAVILIFLVLAFHRLFKNVDKYLAALVVILGGVMPATIDIVNVVSDAGALMVARGADFLSVFDKPQRDGIVMLLLRLHHIQDTAVMILWGAWLFPLAILAYRSRFVPRFLGVWLFLAGCGWSILCITEFLAPQYYDKEFLIFQPIFFGEVALMLWLVIKGAKPLAVNTGSSSVVG